MANTLHDPDAEAAAPKPEAATGEGPRVVLVDDNERRGERSEERLGEQFQVDVFNHPTAAVEELDRMVAVLVVTTSFSRDDLEMLVYTAKGRSPYCHIGLLAKEYKDIAALDVPRDEEFTSPSPGASSSSNSARC